MIYWLFLRQPVFLGFFFYLSRSIYPSVDESSVSAFSLLVTITQSLWIPRGTSLLLIWFHLCYLVTVILVIIVNMLSVAILAPTYVDLSVHEWNSASIYFPWAEEERHAKIVGCSLVEDEVFTHIQHLFREDWISSSHALTPHLIHGSTVIRFPCPPPPPPSLYPTFRIPLAHVQTSRTEDT